MNEQRRKQVEETIQSLERVQKLDATTLSRGDELGRELNFEAAVEPVQRIVDLFQQISKDVLSEFSVQKLNQTKAAADAEWNRLEQIRTFTVTSGNPKATRDNLIKQEDDAYDSTFEQLWPMIAYSVRRATDFQRLEREARASVQATSDNASRAQAEIERLKTEATIALDAIRKVAAEQGVSQQAIHFKNEADEHAKDSAIWLRRTTWLTAGLLAYSVFALFSHNISWLAPANSFESVQIAIGKSLVFITIASYLLFSARSYTAHRHNAIVNRHRQNSLATYKALVEAAGDSANRDIVLTQASESIFGQQATGFTKADGHEGVGPLSLVNVGAGALTKSGG